ncbi:site-specific integrase [Ghiorsea bivora]|uniref:tyrosine-type recombinase/integrase n=1 Tax=Ghiorsea bivora TaxID=1485545 RepID=UPI0022B75920|nr:tyrosine-type recombinase/integrase [Ghiorsea bivora]
MARLMYRVGLSLNELLRLRVQDIGCDYGCLPVHAGKGNKDRTSLLMKALYDDLKAQLHVIRTLFDRMGLPMFGCLIFWQENIRTRQERGHGNLFPHPKRYQKTLRMERFVVTM